MVFILEDEPLDLLEVPLHLGQLVVEGGTGLRGTVQHVARFVLSVVAGFLWAVIVFEFAIEFLVGLVEVVDDLLQFFDLEVEEHLLLVGLLLALLEVVLLVVL